MHFAYPPRKSSNPPPFRPRASKIPSLPSLRRSRLKPIALIVLVVFTIFYILPRWRSSKYEAHKPSGSPPVVLVTVLDVTAYSKAYMQSIRDNRLQYAERHGYKVMFAAIGDYDLHGSPISWNRVVAMRHAMTVYPDATYIWYLDQDSYIMDPTKSLEEHLMSPNKLQELMIKDHPVVPPDSIIKTFSHLRGDEIDFVLTQDREGLSSASFIVRNGEWAKFFLDTWFDPLYRSYNFQKAETHALEHIVQWHPTILSKLALVPQRQINSYNRIDKGEMYEDGDFIVRAAGCTKTGERACEDELEGPKLKWRTAFKNA